MISGVKTVFFEDILKCGTSDLSLVPLVCHYKRVGLFCNTKDSGRKMIECPSSDGINVCVVWNLVDCRNTRVYNTQVVAKIKGKNDRQSRLA